MNMRLGILLSCALFCTTPHVHAHKKSHTVISKVDKFITQARDQLSRIKACIRSLNIVIVKEKKFGPKKRAAIQAHFSQLLMLIESIEQEQFRNANLQSCQMLVTFNGALAHHLNEIRRNQFKGIKQFKIEEFIQKIEQKRALPGSDLFKKFMRTSKLIEKMIKEGLGLTSLNRTVRWLDDTLISPALRNSIPSRTLAVLGTAFMGSYIWWHLGHDSFKNLTGRWYELFGAHYDEHGYGINGTPGIISNIDNSLYKLAHGKAEIGKYIGGAAFGYLGNEFYKSVYPKLEKKLSAAWNKAKGGVFVKEAERIEEKVEKVYFKDVFGQTEIINYFKFLVDYLEDAETHDRQGIRPPHGILCIGDTRTGKTHMISAFFHEVDKMLYRTNRVHQIKLMRPSILEIQVQGMENILRRAQNCGKPCIVFIDEIDVLNLTRSDENRVLGTFLTAMSDVLNTNDPKKQVFVIAATNRPETLDKALRQPGRFGKELRFEYPNYEDRYSFLKTKIFEFVLPDQQQFFDIAKLARYCNNKSYESMNLFIRNAMMKAKINNNGELTQEHLEAALEEDVYHIIASNTKDIPLQEQRILAAHLAGQALTLNLLDSPRKLGIATIKQVMTELKEEYMGSHLDKKNKEQQRFEYGKIFTYHEKDSIDMQTCDEKMALIKMNLAGFVAEEILLGGCAYSCHPEDNTNAITIAKSIAFQGAEESTLPKELIKEYYNRALEIVDQGREEVKDLLANNKDKLQLIMDELLEQKTVDQREVKDIIEQKEK